MIGVAMAISQVYAALTPEQQRQYQDNIKAAKYKNLTFEQGCKVVIDLFVLHENSLATIKEACIDDMCKAELATEYVQGIAYAITYLKELNPTGKW